MAKILTTIGMVMAGILALPFLLDLAFGWPFKKASVTMDVAFLICAAVLAFMSWTTMREQI